MFIDRLSAIRAEALVDNPPRFRFCTW